MRAFTLIVTLAFVLGCETQLLTDLDPVAPGEPAEPDDPDLEPGPAPDGCGALARLDELQARFAAELARDGIPGGAVAIACRGSVVTAGVGTDGAGQSVTGETRFQIASTTKSLTASTAVLVEQAGQLDLRAPLDGLLPDINTAAPWNTTLTLEQLLAHTAGYPADIPGGDYSNFSTLEGFFADNAQAQLWSTPGSVWNYANYGTALAGLALERATGTRFAALVHERLIEPFDLDISLDAAAVAAEGRFSLGHEGSAANALGPLDWYYDAAWYGPMGGAWASAEGLGRYASLFLGDEAFDAVAAAVTTPVSRTSYGPDLGYGLGMFIDETGDRPVWSHDGGVGGFSTSMMIFPDAGVAVALLVNGDWGFPSDTVAFASAELGEVGYGAWSPPPALGDDLVGGYEDEVVLGQVNISAGPGGLVADFVDLGFSAPIESLAEDTGVFFYEPWGFELNLSVWRDPLGAVEFVSVEAGVLHPRP